METKNKAWKTLSSEYIFRRPWLTVRQDEFLLPTGNRIPEYYILEYPGLGKYDCDHPRRTLCFCTTIQTRNCANML